MKCSIIRLEVSVGEMLLRDLGPIMHDTRSIFSINRHIDRDIDIAAQSVKIR